MTRIVSLFLILTIYCAKSYSQTQTDPNQPLIPQPVPPSPTAAALGKYGEVPVSMYTGIPTINVPIWQVDEGDIHVPISLSYHSGGVKVEENASWVGLGWSLQAGGVITRAVRGRPDESGYLSGTAASGDRNNLMPALLKDLLNAGPGASVCDAKDAANYASYVVQSGFDSEPDIYFYNFNGISGKFVLDQNGVAYTIPYQKIKIERVNNLGWQITMPDGMLYKFISVGESTLNTNLSYDIYGGVEGDFPTSTPPFTSAWYMSSIVSPTGHTVNFSYVNETYQLYSGFSQYLMWDISTAQNFNASNYVTTTGSKSQISGARLSAISFSNGHIDFVATKVREDLASSFNPNALEKIVISNPDGVIRNFVLNTDYFTSSDAVQNFNTKRLRLNSVTEWNGDMTLSKPPHLFSYDNSGSLPSKRSSSQDHWGYYNGKANVDINNNPTLIPDTKQGVLDIVTEKYYEYGNGTAPITDNYYNNGISLLHFTGADRTPDFNFSKIGVLNKIVYPTGGYTNFEYEPHDYDLKPGNYIYSAVQHSLESFAWTSPNIQPSDSIVCSDVSCTNIKNIDLAPYINAANSDVNPYVYADLTFDFYNGGNGFYCCGYILPVAVFMDVTANKELFNIWGAVGSIKTLDGSINMQINEGTIQVSGDFDQTTHYDIPGWQVTQYPSFKYSHVRLDRTHVYRLQTTSWKSPRGACEPRTDCPVPAIDYVTFADVKMDFSINTNSIAKYNGLLGGLRIKKLSDYSNISAPVIRKYVYRLAANPQVSSGVIEDMPIYVDQGIKSFSNANAGDPFGDKDNPSFLPVFISALSTKTLTLTSGSKFELGQTSGSHVGYKEVQEFLCSDDACANSPVGSSIYKFTSSDDYKDINTSEFGYAFRGDVWSSCSTGSTWNLYEFDLRWMTATSQDPNNHYYPYPPKTNYDWKRGLPLSEAHYDNNGVLKKKVESTYNLVGDNNNLKIINGLKIVTAPKSRINDMYFGRYDIVAAWNYKNQDKITEIDDANNQIVTTTNYFYDNPSLSFLTRKEVLNSKNETLKTTFAYPADLGVQQPYTTMVSRFLLAPVVSQSSYKNGSFLASSNTNYKDWGNGIIAPETIQTTVLNYPADTRIHFYKYDNTGNFLSAAKENDKFVNYLYDYHQIYPIAQAENPSGDVIAATSFEADGSGNWQIASTARDALNAITGRKSYNLSSGNITLPAATLNPAKKYVVSYWSKGGIYNIGAGNLGSITGRSAAGWTYYEHSFMPASQGNITITGTGLIDELRIYPAGAQMTTYTYNPLVGLTSQCDVNNRITYHEYDGLGRLLRIRDMDNYILKQFEYQYQVYGTTAAVWKTNGQIRCKPCPAGGSYITNMQQHQEADVNSQSSTYNTTRWVDDGTAGTCVISPDWQYTATAIRCKVNGTQNTGQQEREQKDLNPCSSTYNQLKWVVTGTNLTACPTCTSSTCASPDHKCINGVCETGTLGIVRQRVQGAMCIVDMGYFFSDNTYIFAYTTTHNGMCVQP